MKRSLEDAFVPIQAPVVPNFQIEDRAWDLLGLIGREQELRTVRQLLLCPATRLVTLTGTGGSGKTRLGLQVASELLHQFESRVYFVALASITDPAMVPTAIAEWVSTG